MSFEASLGQQRTALWELQFGARPLPDGSTVFRIWAPRVDRLSVKILGRTPRVVPLVRDQEGVFGARVTGVAAGADYLYVINDEQERPDPVSRWQPEGVHGPSRVVDARSFEWSDREWRGLPLRDYIIYELHTGTFTPEGTFEAIIPRLPHLKSLGVTAVELMPVSQFPGGRNWGYDGAYLYAPQSTYGGPEGLKRLIDACHGEGLAVVMDVVYNHLGPEGNYLGEYAPIYSENYRTPWGSAINFDGPESDGVRRLFIDNALYWLTEYHVDALRLDAIHRIIDISPRHVLTDIAEAFRRQARLLDRDAWTIAESDLNDVRVIRPETEGGYGLDAQWSDDFHHSTHALLVGTSRGYFADFQGMADLVKAITEGFVYDGQRSPFRKKSHGNSSKERPGEQFVVYLQNHDQIANSYWGDRLSGLLPFEQQKLAASILFCAPNLPMLFMGQEWGEVAPFLYFTSHTDPDLARAVRRGRREEYASFVKEDDDAPAAGGDFHDPQSEDTFERSKIVWSRLGESPHAEVFSLYRDLIAARRRYACLSNCDKERTNVTCDEKGRWMAIERGDAGGSGALLLCNFSVDARPMTAAAAGAWRLVLWTGDGRYGGASDLAPRPPAELSGSDAAGRPGVVLPGGTAALYVRSPADEV